MSDDIKLTPTTHPHIFRDGGKEIKDNSGKKKGYSPVPIDERVAIVNDVVNNKLNPAWKERAPDDLEKFFGKLNHLDGQVRWAMQPVIDNMITNGTIHTDQGRNALLVKIQGTYTERFRELSREEAIFALAYTHARILLQENV